MRHIITSTSAYRRLAEEVIARMEYGDFKGAMPTSVANIRELNPDIMNQLIIDNYGDFNTNIFPDGESYHQYNDFDRYSGKDVVLIGGTISDSDTLELFHMGCTMAEVVRSLTIVVPYFGYSTMERRTKPGEIVKAEKNMHLLRSIPNGEVKNTFIFFDMHTEGLPYYLGADVRKFHLYTKALVFNACKEISKDGNFVFGSVDTGRSKWIESLAKDMSIGFGRKIEPAIISKNRKSGTETEITGHQGANPNGRIVIIYDDMVRTGGSVRSAAKLYRELGASEIHMITTHALFPKISKEIPGGPITSKMVPSSVVLLDGVLDSLWVTDTHPNAYKEGMGNIRVQTIAGLIANAVQKKSEFIQ